MHLKTLGRLELEGGTLSRPKPLLLLTYLTLEGSKSRTDLAELFYMGARDPMSSLRVALSHLRSDAEAACRLEGSRLESLISSDAKELLVAWEGQDYERVTALYDGSFLDGFSLKDWSVELEDWVYGTREYLALLVRKSFLRLAQQVAEASFKEAARLAAKGYKVSGAPEPEPEELRQLYQLMLAANHPDLPEIRKLAEDYGFELEPAQASFQTQIALSDNPKTPTNLQAKASSFVGRVQERAELKDLLKSPAYRLITVHGQGGAGKTRLVLQIGLELLQEELFQDGIYFVALESLSQASHIASSLATTLGLSLTGEQAIEQIAAFIGQKNLLLILDNFEHLADGALICSDLLRSCPHLSLLVSSREALNLAEEAIYELKGLNLPASENISLELAQRYDVIQLFYDRARRIKLSYQAVQEDLPQIIRLCQILEGLPLGIELAAAGLKLMPVKDIVLSLQEGIDALYSPSQDLSERQKSLRATFDYSWQLLTTLEQKALVQLAVFKGGFSRDAASQVAAVTLPVLRSLVDKALLRVSPEGRFDVHRLLHQYLQEKLAKDPDYPATQAGHAEFYINLSETAEPKLIGKDQLEWLNRLELEQGNLRAALRWNLAQSPEHALRQAAALRRFWEIRGHFAEGLSYLERAVLKAVDKQTETYLKTIYALGALLRSNFKNDEAEPYFTEAESLAKALGDKQILADTLNQLAGIAWAKGNLETSNDLLNQSLDIKRELGDKRGVATSLGNLALLAKLQKNIELAKTLYFESLEIYTSLADDTSRANVLRNLGRALVLEGNLLQAQAYFEKGVNIFEELGNKKMQGQVFNDLASIMCFKGEFGNAIELLEKSSELAKEVGSKRDIANVLQGFGLVSYSKYKFKEAEDYFQEGLLVAYEIGDLEGISTAVEGLASIAVQKQDCLLATKLWGASINLAEDSHLIKTYLKSRYESDMAKAKNSLGEQFFLEQFKKGQALSVDEVISLVLDSSGNVGKNIKRREIDD